MMTRRIAAALICLLIPTHYAYAEFAVRMKSTSSGKCIHLKSPDQPDGAGGLEMSECQNFPDFFVTYLGGTTPLQFRLNSGRFACMTATENPGSSPGVRDKVSSNGCLPTSNWKIRGLLGGPPEDRTYLVEKLKQIDPSLHCLAENTETGGLELDLCQEVPKQQWRLELIQFPPAE